MGLSIKHPRADALAREVATRTGESLTDAIIHALEERLRCLPQHNQTHDEMLRQELRAIRERCRCMPIFDRRSPDEMIGYDERGLPR